MYRIIFVIIQDQSRRLRRRDAERVQILKLLMSDLIRGFGSVLVPGSGGSAS